MQKPNLDDTLTYLDRMSYILEFIRIHITDCAVGGCMGMKTANTIQFALETLIDHNQSSKDEVYNIIDFLNKLGN